MKINNNIPALQVYASMTRTNRAIETSMKRLGSGIRINSVKDDAAGMSIANKLSAQVSGIEMAGRNTLDGISLLQTAEGALQEVHNMIARMRELAVEASNGTLEPGDRIKMNEEIAQLIEEVNNIAYKTEFNTIKMLNGDASRLSKVSGPNSPNVKIAYISDTVVPGDLTYAVSSAGLPAYAQGVGGLGNISSLRGEKLVINGESIEVDRYETPASFYEKLSALADSCNLKLWHENGDINGYVNGTNKKVMLYTKECGSDQNLNISGSSGLMAALGLGVVSPGRDAVISSQPTLNGQSMSYSVKGNTIQFTGDNRQKITVELQMKSFNGSGGFSPDSNGNFIMADSGMINMNTGLLATPIDETGAGTAGTTRILDYGYLRLQIGANKNMEMDIQLADLSAKGIGIENMSIASVQNAQRALDLCARAQDIVSEVRAKLGAYQNRLEHTSNSLSVTGEATQKALSRIMDTDMAWEMTLLAKENVKSQAGTAIMAQANQRPQQILQLLN